MPTDNQDILDLIESRAEKMGVDKEWLAKHLITGSVSKPAPEVVETEILEPEMVEVKDINLWNSGDWFKEHPEKVLGEKYETSGRFGRVYKYKGSIVDVDRIDVPLNFLSNTKAENDPLLSVGGLDNPAIKVINPQNEAWVDTVLEQASNERLKAKAKAKAKKATVVETQDAAELQTFEDIFRQYNPKITHEELQAFVYWKSAIGRPLSNNWLKLVSPDSFSGNEDMAFMREKAYYHVSEEKVADWVKEGLLFYFNSQLEPAPVYLSGDIYAKKAQLDRDKSEIIRKYGEDTFTNQENALQQAYLVKYNNRLTFTQGEDGIVLLPNSKFAKSFRISKIEINAEGEEGFKITTFGTKDKYGQPNWKKEITEYTQEYRKDTFETLTLQEAFIFWINKAQPQLKEPINHWQIIDVYVLQNWPRVASKDRDPDEVKKERAQVEKLKTSCAKEGNRLFKIFITTQLLPSDLVKLEMQWNIDFNNYLPIDYDKIPVAFTMTKYYKGKPETIRHEKREAVAFVMTNGTGCLAFDVGVGKTPSAIFTMSAFLDAGYCKRPFLTVPNQVYKQFISEIKNFAPHIPIIEGYNMSEKYVNNFRDETGNIVPTPEGSITVFTYEGLERIGFNEDTASNLTQTLYDILNQGGESERQGKNLPAFFEKLEKLVGRGMQGTMYNIEDFGFDFGCYDEAHKMKKVFTAVKGEEVEGSNKREKNPYVINSGVPSSIALKGFMLNYYILSKNNMQNVLLLTATPFTNSPLEIFSMLAMLAYQQLESNGLNNLKDFFDTYVATSNELVIDAKMRPAFKQVIMGFNNLVSLQSLIRRFINYKTGEDVGVQRPQKYVLPYLRRLEGGTVVTLSEVERVETYIEMTDFQKNTMEQIVRYVESGDSSFLRGLDVDSDSDQEDEGYITSSDGDDEISEEGLSNDDKLGVRILKGLNYARNLALNPYLLQKTSPSAVDYEDFITKSPKMLYVMECIKTVREYHLNRGETISGQVIYMDRGVEYFHLIREYLIQKVGYQPHEVGIIKSGLPKDGPKSKEAIKNLFNGERFNEETKDFEPVADEARIKVIIGSSTIKEGINLQKYGTVLYNTFIDWNPTDQQQLEGRIYRQGNLFSAVRIVIPMVVDSADTFIFQKLQEKTSRLNSLWSMDGRKNVISVDEFDPKEFKFALIRNPLVVAELMIIEKEAALKSEKMNYERNIEAANQLTSKAYTLRQRTKTLFESFEDYSDAKPSGNVLLDAVKAKDIVLNLLKAKKDQKGRPWKRSWWEVRDEPELLDKEGKVIQESDLEKYNKPYYFTEYAQGLRDVQKGINEFLKPFGIDWDLRNDDPVEYFIQDSKAQITKIEAEIENIGSDENKDRLAREVIAERKANKIAPKNVYQNAKEFTKLNYLLSERKIDFKPEVISTPIAVPVVEKAKAAKVKANKPRVESVEPVGSDKDVVERKIDNLTLLMGMVSSQEAVSIQRKIENLKILQSLAA